MQEPQPWNSRDWWFFNHFWTLVYGDYLVI
jgi:hypothetical protein